MSNQIYSAKYSGMDVYEYIHPTGSVMKRKKDNWVNATHILKAANFAKARRTRILEQEVLKGVHEKVQGGFGKYQGTWVPIDIGIRLAEKFGVYDELKALFDYTKRDGSESPPLAPKHHHATRSDISKRKAAAAAAATTAATATVVNPKVPTPTDTAADASLTVPTAAKSASMSVLEGKASTGRPGRPRGRTKKTDTGNTSSASAAIPKVPRRRGRPPKVKKQKEAGDGEEEEEDTLSNAITLRRSQSDMVFAKSGSQQSSVHLNELPPLRSSSKGIQDLQNTQQYSLQSRFHEIDIDDGISSDIEPMYTGNMLQQDMVQRYMGSKPYGLVSPETYSYRQQTQLQGQQQDHDRRQNNNSGDHNSNSNNNNNNHGTQSDGQATLFGLTSSPAFPTSPSGQSETNPFDPPTYSTAGTSPLVSAIPRYPVTTRPKNPSNGAFSTTVVTSETPNPRDKVNEYLSKLVDYFISSKPRKHTGTEATDNVTDSPQPPSELLLPPENCATYIDTPIDPELHTAFHWACAMGDVRIAEVLYKAGSNPRAVNKYGQTALIRCCMFHNAYTNHSFEKIIDLLFDTVFQADSSGETVLHHIVKRRSLTPSAVHYLGVILSKLKGNAPRCKLEAFVNARDHCGETALHVAARNGDKYFFDTLVSSGALSTIGNKDGVTPDELLNQAYERQLMLLEYGKVDTGAGVTISDASIANTTVNERKGQKFENGGKLLGEYSSMYKSQAAVRFSKGVPKIVNTLKSFAKEYNDAYNTREAIIRNLSESIENVASNVRHVDSKTSDILLSGEDAVGEDDTSDIEKLFATRNERIKKLSEEKSNVVNKLERMLTAEQASILKFVSEKVATSENEETVECQLAMSIELSRLQLQRKRKSDMVLDLVEEGSSGSKMFKYRKTISEGTDIALPDVDKCLDIILRVLANNSSNTDG